MAVPKFYRFIRPSLEALSDGEKRHWTEVQAICVEALALTDEDLEDLIPSGVRSRVADRVLWALTYLRQAALAEKAGRGITRITDRGREYLTVAPDVIRPADLKQFPEFAEFVGGKEGPEPQPLDETKGDETPEDRMESAFSEHEKALALEVLDAVKSTSAARFERLIVQLMLALGYGGTEDSGRVLGGSGDGGVDGVIDMDKLGLEKVYLQAKKWTDNPVGRKEVQAFVGALSGQGASKGVFITSSTFSRQALDYAKAIQTCSLSLVDGVELARTMVKYDIGVALLHRYELKRLDSDFFDGT